MVLYCTAQLPNMHYTPKACITRLKLCIWASSKGRRKKNKQKILSAMRTHCWFSFLPLIPAYPYHFHRNLLALVRLLDSKDFCHEDKSPTCTLEKKVRLKGEDARWTWMCTFTSSIFANSCHTARIGIIYNRCEKFFTPVHHLLALTFGR